MVDIPVPLLTCKYDGGVGDDDELALLAKCRKDILSSCSRSLGKKMKTKEMSSSEDGNRK